MSGLNTSESGFSRANSQSASSNLFQQQIRNQDERNNTRYQELFRSAWLCIQYRPGRLTGWVSHRFDGHDESSSTIRLVALQSSSFLSSPRPRIQQTVTLESPRRQKWKARQRWSRNEREEEKDNRKAERFPVRARSHS